MDAFLDLARTRRSIRAYSPKPVEFEKVMEVIRAGGYAPSVGDLQMWQFIIVTDDDTQKALVGSCPQQNWLYNAPTLIVLTSDVGKVTDFYGEFADRWCSQSCAAAVQNMLLAATDIGLGACWVGSFDTENVRDILKIPDGFRPEVIIALGYADETPQDKALRPLDQCVFFNVYGGKLESWHSMLRDWADHFREQGQQTKKKIQVATDSSETGQKAKESAKNVLEKAKVFFKKK